MRVVDPAGLPPGDGPVCVVVRRDEAAVADVLARLGLEPPPHLWASGEHPDVRVDETWVTVVAAGNDEHGDLVSWTFAATDGLLLVAGGGSGADVVRSAVESAGDDPALALVAAVLGLARDAGECLQQLGDQVAELDSSTRQLSRSGERREIRQLRERLFRLREVYGAQVELLDPDEELAQRLGDDGASLLRRARTAYRLDQSVSAGLYALAGDLMAEQTALVNERLTLVSTFFLPLTVSTSFFGMNLGWMTDRVGSLTAFVVLGFAVPVLATVATFLVVKGMGATGD